MTPIDSIKALNLDRTVVRGWLKQLKEPKRFYHTDLHIEHMLYNLPAPAASREMVAAIWLHDIVYDPTKHDNEEQSAQQATYDLHDSGIDVPLVISLIMGTKHHEPGFEAQNVLNDLDLLILGETPGLYARYSRAIRSEYAHVPVEVYNPNRALFLEHLIERPRIYQTRPFDCHEKQARENLAREIESLRA
jgi:predicted metal-dependent HD superfamily phosphohydrolase